MALQLTPEQRQTMTETLQRVKNGKLEELTEQYVELSLMAGNNDSIFHYWKLACEEECVARGRNLLYTGIVEKVERRLGIRERR